MSGDFEFPRWTEAVCIASGPSLTREDCTRVAAWRYANDGRGVIVTNSAFRAATFADILYAADRKWWAKYYHDVPSNMVKVSHRDFPGVFRCYTLDAVNSGANAIALACATGAKRITLLGYDCQRTDGKSHFHGDHPPPLGNCGSIGDWDQKFHQIFAQFKHRDIVNCTRTTALRYFPRMRLEDRLCCE